VYTLYFFVHIRLYHTTNMITIVSTVIKDFNRAITISVNEQKIGKLLPPNEVQAMMMAITNPIENDQQLTKNKALIANQCEKTITKIVCFKNIP